MRWSGPCAGAWSPTWCCDPPGWCDASGGMLPAWSTWAVLWPLAGVGPHRRGRA
jgi:hypothetical protein